MGRKDQKVVRKAAGKEQRKLLVETAPKHGADEKSVSDDLTGKVAKMALEPRKPTDRR